MVAHEKDHSGFLLAGAITWVILLPIAFVGMVVDVARPFGLLVPLFGLAAWTLLMGLLLFVRPRKVQRLAPRLAPFSSQISSPQEAGVWCFWLSALCWYAGALWIAEIFHHAPSGLAGYVFGLSLFGGFWLGRWWGWRHVRRP